MYGKKKTKRRKIEIEIIIVCFPSALTILQLIILMIKIPLEALGSFTSHSFLETD